MSIKIIFAEGFGDEPELRFVEVENGKGESVSVGEWSDDKRGYKVLSLTCTELAEHII